MAKRSVAVRLREMIEAIDGAIDIVDGVDLAAYRQDFAKRMAIERCVEIVSEASRRIPDELKQMHPDVLWPEIQAIGN